MAYFRQIAFVLCLVTFVGCNRQPKVEVVVMTNVVEDVRELVVTNAVTVTNVVVERRQETVAPRPQLTSRRTAPYVVSSSVMTPLQLRDVLIEGAAKVLDFRVSAVVEANEKVLAKLAEKGTISICALDARTKVEYAAESGGRVAVRAVSSLDRPAICKAVADLSGEVSTLSPTVGSPVILCKVSEESLMKLAARPDVWSIERYGK